MTAVEPAESVQPPELTVVQCLAQHRQRVSPINVLVVDDQRQSRMMLETLLEQMGHRPTGCQHADRALERLQQHAYGLVLADFHMPGMNGLQLLEILRHEFPQLPFVLVTADDGAATANDALGNVRRLIKPVHPKTLCALIEDVFANAG